MSCGNSNWTVSNISNARFLFYFFSGPDAIEKHIVTKVKLLFIGDIFKYFNVVQSDLKIIYKLRRLYITF